MENTLENLRQYFHRTSGVQPATITRETSLLNDLNFRGDDIDELFSRLVIDFSVDVKKLDLSRFVIGEEPLDFLSPLVRFFRGERSTVKSDLLVGDIVRFIETGILE